MMIALLLAVASSGPVASDCGYHLPAEGRDAAAISALEANRDAAEDPARMINLGIAYARRGEEAKARAMFELAHRARDRVELETATGGMDRFRVLATQAIAMLDGGRFTASGRIARN